MNWCVYSALRDCQNLHRDRLSDWLAIGFTATTTTTTNTNTNLLIYYYYYYDYDYYYY